MLDTQMYLSVCGGNLINRGDCASTENKPRHPFPQLCCFPPLSEIPESQSEISWRKSRHKCNEPGVTNMCYSLYSCEKGMKPHFTRSRFGRQVFPITKTCPQQPPLTLTQSQSLFLGKCFPTEPWFPYLQNGHKNSCDLTALQ